jgi:hypothetical protein
MKLIQNINKNPVILVVGDCYSWQDLKDKMEADNVGVTVSTRDSIVVLGVKYLFINFLYENNWDPFLCGLKIDSIFPIDCKGIGLMRRKEFTDAITPCLVQI